MTKLTEKEKEEIKKLYAEGKTLEEIAEQFGIALSTVVYWTNDKYQTNLRKNNRDYQKRLYETNNKDANENKEKRKAYMKEYMKNRCHNDEKFRLKLIERVKKNKLKQG